MKPSSTHELLDDALRICIPENASVLPGLTARYVKGKSSMKTATRISLGVFLALIALAVTLLAFPDVALALQHLFGYLPGVGIVDESRGPRNLAEPVSQTRAGITVTVADVTISEILTSIHLKISGIPASAYPADEPGAGSSGRTAAPAQEPVSTATMAAPRIRPAILPGR